MNSVIHILGIGIWRTYQDILQNPLYWAGVLVCYVVYERKAPHQSLRLTVFSAVQGLVVGSILTGGIMGIGLFIRQQHVLIALLPISLLLSKIRKRWICYAYSTAVLSLPLYILGIMEAQTASAILCIVGLLHAAEAVLCSMSKERERIWPLPFGVLLEAKSGSSALMPAWWPVYGEVSYLSILPLTALLAYHGKGTERCRDSIWIWSYGILILGAGLISFWIQWMVIPAILMQVLLHELITIRS